jgi:hypothetical protein
LTIIIQLDVLGEGSGICIWAARAGHNDTIIIHMEVIIEEFTVDTSLFNDEAFFASLRTYTVTKPIDTTLLNNRPRLFKAANLLFRSP